MIRGDIEENRLDRRETGILTTVETHYLVGSTKRTSAALVVYFETARVTPWSESGESS